jgi:hypothetical protein
LLSPCVCTPNYKSDINYHTTEFFLTFLLSLPLLQRFSIIDSFSANRERKFNVRFGGDNDFFAGAFLAEIFGRWKFGGSMGGFAENLETERPFRKLIIKFTMILKTGKIFNDLEYR